MKVIVFSSPGCNPCDQVKKFLRDHEVEFELYSYDRAPEYFKKYDVNTVPTTVLFNAKNEPVAQIFGFKPGPLKALVDTVKNNG